MTCLTDGLEAGCIAARACGTVSPLFTDVDGTSQREALRGWRMGTGRPLARLLLLDSTNPEFHGSSEMRSQGWSAKPLVSAHDRIIGTHRLRTRFAGSRNAFRLISQRVEDRSSWGR